MARCDEALLLDGRLVVLNLAVRSLLAVVLENVIFDEGVIHPAVDGEVGVAVVLEALVTRESDAAATLASR